MEIDFSRVALWLFLALSPLHSFAGECPAGSQRGRQLEAGLYQLTAVDTDPVTGRASMKEIADPAPPLVNKNGEVEIYGTGNTFIRYKNWEEFERGGCFQIIKLRLLSSAREGGLNLPDAPWDIRKFQITDINGESSEFLLGGAMRPLRGKLVPRMPDDNLNRRVFRYHASEYADGSWVRDPKPFARPDSMGWLGHSYGGNLLQVDNPNANNIDAREPGTTFFFYEKVSNAEGNIPKNTDLFMKDIREPDRAETPIFKSGQSPYPAVRRVDGGTLAEGPRPIQVTLEGQSFFIVGFSSGDFPTDHYSINFLWSKSASGPYRPILNSSQTDLEDFGAPFKSRYGLSWVGRPALFRTPDGNYEMLFHGLFKSAIPDNDYGHWPTHHALHEFVRAIFKVSVNLSLSKSGVPIIELE